MIRLGLIGAGNIMATRHLPALQKQKNLFTIVGIMDTHGTRAARLAEKYRIPHHTEYRPQSSLSTISWFKEVEAVIVAVPPLSHSTMVKLALQAGKHVLVEKPFVVDISEGKKLLDYAKKKKLQLAVSHNFQYSSAFTALEKEIKQHTLGSIKSFYCTQLSNETRRLPVWAEELPFGLFYDETPHVFYLLKKFCRAPLHVDHVQIQRSTQKKKNTPQVIHISLHSGTIPITIYCNFESPVCEWYFMVLGEKKLAVVDMFRDILTILPNDGKHLMIEVITTSLISTYSHWRGVLVNGLQYLRHNLFYGIDTVHENFYHVVNTQNQKYVKGMSGTDGLEINVLQHEIINYR